jgi:hypothetical protein
MNRPSAPPTRRPLEQGDTRGISCEEICTPRKADFGQMIFLVPLLNLYGLTSPDGTGASGPVAAPQTLFADVGSEGREPPKDMPGDATSWDPSDWVSGISPYAADVLAREAVSDWSTVSETGHRKVCHFVPVGRLSNGNRLPGFVVE